MKIKGFGAQFKRTETCVVFLLALFTSIHASGENASSTSDASHDYISCAVITSEYLTILQLYQRGIDQKTALETLPLSNSAQKDNLRTLYEAIRKDGVLNTYSAINSNFARCATHVAAERGEPEKNTLEYNYYFCAGENKLRYEIILYTNESYDIDAVLKQIPDSHFDVAINYFRLIENQGLLAAFDYTANNFKACLAPL